MKIIDYYEVMIIEDIARTPLCGTKTQSIKCMDEPGFNTDSNSWRLDEIDGRKTFIKNNAIDSISWAAVYKAVSK